MRRPHRCQQGRILKPLHGPEFRKGRLGGEKRFRSGSTQATWRGQQAAGASPVDRHSQTHQRTYTISVIDYIRLWPDPLFHFPPHLVVGADSSERRGRGQDRGHDFLFESSQDGLDQMVNVRADSGRHLARPFPRFRRFRPRMRSHQARGASTRRRKK